MTSSPSPHSVNDRLMEKLIELQRLVEEQRVQIVHLEANARMTKAELNTPDKNVSRQLFADPVHPSASQSQNDASGNSAGSNSQNGAPGNSTGSDPRAPSGSKQLQFHE